MGTNISYLKQIINLDSFHYHASIITITLGVHEQHVLFNILNKPRPSELYPQNLQINNLYIRDCNQYQIIN